MSNGIATRQNEDNSIAMLAAQRQLYRDAKKYNTVSVALSVWIPFALAVILLFISENTKWRYASYILSIVSMAFSFVIDKYIEEKKQLAAFIQQKFDVYVYEMPWDKRIFGILIKMIPTVKRRNFAHVFMTYGKPFTLRANRAFLINKCWIYYWSIWMEGSLIIWRMKSMILSLSILRVKMSLQRTVPFEGHG